MRFTCHNYGKITEIMGAVVFSIGNKRNGLKFN